LHGIIHVQVLRTNYISSCVDMKICFFFRHFRQFENLFSLGIARRYIYLSLVACKAIQKGINGHYSFFIGALFLRLLKYAWNYKKIM